MKKILFVLLILSICTKVNAYTYYTDYKKLESVNKMDESDLVELNKELNIYYNQDVEFGPYLSNSNNEYKYLDKSDYIMYKSDLLFERPKEKSNREIYEVIDNFSNTKVRHINIQQANTRDEYVTIKNVKIKVDGKEIKYGFSCNACTFDNKIFNITGNSNLLFDLKGEYNIEQLDISFNVENLSNETEKFYMYLTPDTSPYRIYYKEFECKFKDSLYTYNLKDQGIEYTIGNYPLKKLYYYVDKYYRTYNTYNTYSDYLEHGDDYYNIKDNRTKYIYKVRDKLVLEDKLLIDNKDYNLKNFIKENTKDVDIVDNIDISKDGLYEVIYKMDNNEFKVYVTVDINQEDYNKMVSIVNDYSNISKSKTNIINGLNNENNLLTQKMDLLTKDYENRILNLNSQLDAKEKKKDNSNMLQIKPNKTNLYILLCVGIIITIYIFFKYKKYNYFCRKRIKKLKSVLNYIR